MRHIRISYRLPDFSSFLLPDPTEEIILAENSLHMDRQQNIHYICHNHFILVMQLKEFYNQNQLREYSLDIPTPYTY